jgi:GH35 family endo-1,4-beta-xylanase
MSKANQIELHIKTVIRKYRKQHSLDVWFHLKGIMRAVLQ